MKELLSNYHPISLSEMNGVKLLNRTDTKFVTTLDKLRQLLLLAENDYRVQEINGKRIAPYYTVYFDTPQHDMFMAHQDGHANRQKLRIRSYVDSGLNYLEIKSKNNHGRTKKERIPLSNFNYSNPNHNISFCYKDHSINKITNFLRSNLRYDPETLSEQLENHFNRITLVNRGMTERLTIDTHLNFNNLQTGNSYDLPDIAIIEIKRDGLIPSPIISILRELRIHPMGFSKYILGSALTNNVLKHNRLKPRLRKIYKMNNDIIPSNL